MFAFGNKIHDLKTLNKYERKCSYLCFGISEESEKVREP